MTYLKYFFKKVKCLRLEKDFFKLKNELDALFLEYSLLENKVVEINRYFSSHKKRFIGKRLDHLSLKFQKKTDDLISLKNELYNFEKANSSFTVKYINTLIEIMR